MVTKAHIYPGGDWRMLASMTLSGGPVTACGDLTKGAVTT
jgi:hypothetical protein